MIDFNLSVCPDYYGEYLDAWGIYRALEELGYKVRIHEMGITVNIKQPVYIPPTKVNINFHSSYHVAQNAEQNFLFYHEVHDKIDANDPNIPLGAFQKYMGVFTPAKLFADALGIDHLQMAADPYYYHKIPYKKVPAEFKCDVVFIGNNHPNRDTNIVTDILKGLIDKYNVHVYGKGWDIPEARGILPWSKAKYAYSGAKVGLNVSGEGMARWGLGTNRLYQMGACGLATVSYTTDDYRDAYDINRNPTVMWANDTEEFVTKIEYLLEDSKVRRDFAKAFHNRTLKHHLWEHRIPDLLKIIDSPNRGFRSMPLQKNHVDELYAVDLLIGIPGEPRDLFTLGMMKAIDMGEPKIKYDIIMPKRSFTIADARNKMCKDLIAGRYRYLLMIDTDLKIPQNTIDCLLEDVDNHDLDIVCGYYHRIEENNKVLPHFHIEVDGVVLQPGKFKDNALIRCYNAPPGLMMISRRVIERFNEEGIDPFVMTPELSEGPYFCKHAKQFGFEIYVDPRIKATHIRTALLKENGEVDLL